MRSAGISLCMPLLLSALVAVTAPWAGRLPPRAAAWLLACAAVVAGSVWVAILTFLDDPVPTAFALPGTPGRIVVSSGMLQALSTDERRALLAHERAHLRHRHHLFLLVFQLAAAVNPLLRPLTRTGAFALERWADEEAVAAIADRHLIARAALAAERAPQPAMSATGGPVPQRVRALLAPPTPLRHNLVVAFATVMAVCRASLALAAHDTERLFESAMPSHSTSAHTH